MKTKTMQMKSATWLVLLGYIWGRAPLICFGMDVRTLLLECEGSVDVPASKMP